MVNIKAEDSDPFIRVNLLISKSQKEFIDSQSVSASEYIRNLIEKQMQEPNIHTHESIPTHNVLETTIKAEIELWRSLDWKVDASTVDAFVLRFCTNNPSVSKETVKEILLKLIEKEERRY